METDSTTIRTIEEEIIINKVISSDRPDAHTARYDRQLR